MHEKDHQDILPRKTTWRRTVEAEMKELGYNWGELEKIAQNRDEWRVLGHNKDKVGRFTPQPNNSYIQLARSEQIIIFRFGTGHNRLNQHFDRKQNHLQCINVVKRNKTPNTFYRYVQN